MKISGRRLRTARDKVAGTRARSDTVHIISSDNRWAIKREGTKKASLVVDTKADALRNGRVLKHVRNIVVHKKDGTVERWIR